MAKIFLPLVVISLIDLADINECSDMESACGPRSTCFNLEGTYRCDCGEGYEVVQLGNDTICDGERERENCPFLALKKEQVTEGPMVRDHPTVYPTDASSYRDAKTHLKKVKERRNLLIAKDENDD